MALIAHKSVPVFDLTVVHAGDAVRVCRASETTAHNGIITQAYDRQLQVLVPHMQSNATRFMLVDAADVAKGMWDIWWTADFETINHSPPVGKGA